MSNTPNPSILNRVNLNVWGTRVATNILMGDRSGFKRQFYVGQALSEYGSLINQPYDPQTLNPVKGIGGFGEVYYYFTEALHLHLGYGIDSPFISTIGSNSINNNQTAYANLIWNLSLQLQISNELDYRKTSYTQLGNKDG